MRKLQMNETLKDCSWQEIVELTAEEIQQIYGASEVAAAKMAAVGPYPEVENDPP